MWTVLVLKSVPTASSVGNSSTSPVQKETSSIARENLVVYALSTWRMVFSLRTVMVAGLRSLRGRDGSPRMVNVKWSADSSVGQKEAKAWSRGKYLRYRARTRR